MLPPRGLRRLGPRSRRVAARGERRGGPWQSEPAPSTATSCCRTRARALNGARRHVRRGAGFIFPAVSARDRHHPRGEGAAGTPSSRQDPRKWAVLLRGEPPSQTRRQPARRQHPCMNAGERATSRRCRRHKEKKIKPPKNQSQRDFSVKLQPAEVSGSRGRSRASAARRSLTLPSPRGLTPRGLTSPITDSPSEFSEVAVLQHVSF